MIAGEGGNLDPPLLDARPAIYRAGARQLAAVSAGFSSGIAFASPTGLTGLNPDPTGLSGVNFGSVFTIGVNYGTLEESSVGFGSVFSVVGGDLANGRYRR